VAFGFISNGGGWFFELLLVPAKLRLSNVPGWCVAPAAAVARRSIIAPTALPIGSSKQVT